MSQVSLSVVDESGRKVDQSLSAFSHRVPSKLLEESVEHTSGGG